MVSECIISCRYGATTIFINLIGCSISSFYLVVLNTFSENLDHSGARQWTLQVRLMWLLMCSLSSRQPASALRLLLSQGVFLTIQEHCWGRWVKPCLCIYLKKSALSDQSPVGSKALLAIFPTNAVGHERNKTAQYPKFLSYPCRLSSPQGPCYSPLL